jgi:type II secretory pathway pseudopilin PulG
MAGSIQSRKKALSLIEVCIATGILVILLAAILNSVNQGYRYLRKTRLQTVASFLAQEAMELKFSWNTATNDTLNTVTSFPDFQREVIVSNAPWYVGRLRKIQVNVNWQENGATKTLTLQAYKAKESP